MRFLLFEHEMEYHIAASGMECGEVHAVGDVFAELYLFVYIAISCCDFVIINYLSEHIGYFEGYVFI